MRKLNRLALATIGGGVMLASGLLPPLNMQPVQAQTSSSTLDNNPRFLTRAKNLARQAAERANGGLGLYRADPVMSGPSQSSPYVDNSNGSVTFTFTGGTPGYTTPSIETVATVWTNGAVTLDYNGPVRTAVSDGQQQPPTTAIPPLTREDLPIPIESESPVNVITPDSSPTSTPTTQPGAVIIQPLQGSTPAPINPALPTSSPATTEPPATDGIPSSPVLTTETPSDFGDPVSLPTQAEVSTRPTPAPLPQITNPGLDADVFLTRAKNLARQTAIQANGGLGQYRPDPLMFGPATQSPHTKNQDGSITFNFTGGPPGYQTPSVESEITVTPNNVVTIQYNGPVRQ